MLLNNEIDNLFKEIDLLQQKYNKISEIYDNIQLYYSNETNIKRNQELVYYFLVLIRI